MVAIDSKIDPYIQWNHIDGPVLVCENGSMHWLTYIERLLMFLGFTNVAKLNRKYSKDIWSV
jgi:hypothetical protein